MRSIYGSVTCGAGLNSVISKGVVYNLVVMFIWFEQWLLFVSGAYAYISRCLLLFYGDFRAYVRILLGVYCYFMVIFVRFIDIIYTVFVVLLFFLVFCRSFLL